MHSECHTCNYTNPSDNNHPELLDLRQNIKNSVPVELPLGIADGEVEIAVQAAHLHDRWVTVTGFMDPVATKPEMLTFDDLKASIGKGPAADLSDCTFHASTEDFIAAMKAQRDEAGD